MHVKRIKQLLISRASVQSRKRTGFKEKKNEPLLAASIILLRSIGVAVGFGGRAIEIGEGPNSAGSAARSLRGFLVP